MRWRIALCLLAASAAVVAGSLPAIATVSVPGRAAAAARTGANATAGQPLYAFNTGMALTVRAKPRPGASVRIEPYRGGAGQRWVFGRHQTVRPVADQNLCLNVPGGRYRGGARLQLWTCNGHRSERFATTAPSAHTAVLFIRPAGGTKYCLTSLSAPPYEAGARVGLQACAELTTQAWSRTNLDLVAGDIGNAWALQALQPTKAGSAITGASTSGLSLDQYWIATYTGRREASPVLLQPVADTAMCATLAAPEAEGVALDLAPCANSAGQEFSSVALILNTNYTYAYITPTDGRYCLQPPARGPASVRPIVLGHCIGTPRDFWIVTIDVVTGLTFEYQELYAGTGSLVLSMRVGGSGGPGSGVVLSNDDQAAAQVWTDLVPGQSEAEGNPDGSITLRPLSDESLCLAVPGADYAAGVQLTVQTCDGQPDQEFVHGLPDNPTDLVAAGDGEFCVAAPGGIQAGSPIELEPCAQQDNQTWSAFFDWYSWAGQQLTATGPVNEPGDLVLSGVSSAGGQVNVSPASGIPEWNTSEDWLQVAAGTGYEIQSLYDPGLCLDAPATAAGTQLTATPCTGSPTQTFSYGSTSDNKGILWELSATPRTAKMCVAVGSVSGSAGLPLALQPCSASQADEAWYGPMYQL